MALTEDVIAQTLSSLKTRIKGLRGDRRDAEAKVSKVRSETDVVQSEREDLLANLTAECIQGRNDYSREAIKRDFAMGIKE